MDDKKKLTERGPKVGPSIQRPAGAKPIARKSGGAKPAVARTPIARKVQPVAPPEKGMSIGVAAPKAIQLKKGKVVTSSLRIRAEHNTKSKVVGGLVTGNEVTIYETWTDGKDTWVRIGDGQWCGMVHDGLKLIEYI